MSMSTITPVQEEAIRAYLKDRHIPAGLGNEQEACSIAAINLALTGRLTDVIPDCMSAVIGSWCIAIQDAMPDDLRNSGGWRELLPLAAGTGREHERERLDRIMAWMWGDVLPQLQPLADRQGYGPEWAAMTRQRTAVAAAAYATRDAAAHAADAATSAAHAVAAAAYGARVGEYWQAADPAALLRRLVDIGHGDHG